MKSICVVAMILAFVAGCGPSGSSTGSNPAAKPATTTAISPKVEKALAVAKDLEGSSQPDQVLQKHGLTEQQFEDLMYEIASDPVMSEQYAAKSGG